MTQDASALRVRRIARTAQPVRMPVPRAAAPRVQARRRLVSALPLQIPAHHRGLQAVSAVLTVAGVFTASWERFGNVALGPYNVKLPSVLLSLAVVAGIPLLGRLRILIRTRTGRALVVLGAVLVCLLVVRSLFSADVHAALPQIAAILTGAVLPAVAVAEHAQTRQDVVVLLRWLVAGAVLVSLFGLYQLTAFYLGLPQGVAYDGLGTDGVTGRIAAFNYEPAYFSYYLTLAMGALFTLELLTGRRTPWYLLVGLSLVTTLANARAMLFIAPLLLVLLAFRLRRYRRSWIVLAVCTVGGVALGAVMPSIVFSIENALQPAAAPPAADAGAATPAGSASADPSASAVAAPSVSAQADDGSSPSQTDGEAPPKPVDVLDPNESSSNAPRLASISRSLRVVAAHPIVGVGLGNLPSALRSEQRPRDAEGTPTVANNVWVQAMLDGGAPALALEVGMTALVVLVLLRRRSAVVAPLAAAWLAVLAVGGMLTSYFFTLDVWLVLGLIVAASATLASTTSAHRAAS